MVFRADAAFAKPEIYEAPAIRIPSNDSLERELLPAGRQTELQARGLVQGLSVPGRELEDSAPGGGQVEFHFGELFPRVGFIVTNLETGSRAVWVAYPRHRTLWVYHADRSRVLKEDQHLEEPELLPGFRVLVADLFEGI